MAYGNAYSSFGAGTLAILIGAFSIMAGLILITRPGIGLAALAFILAFYFFVDGITRIAMALQMRPGGGWGWMLFTGILSGILGFEWQILLSEILFVNN